jgi:phytoene dehydrogenase-like protein
MADAAIREHDVVVIGGGHNGLVAACYLARAGLDTVVVEQRDWLGGMTTSRPFVASAPEHILSPGAYENVYLRAAGVADELDLAGFGYRETDAAGWAWLGEDGESLVLHRHVERTVAEIARFSRRDADRYRELVTAGMRILSIQDSYGVGDPRRPGMRTILSAVRTVASDRTVRSLLAGMLTGTGADAIASTFESEAVRGVFACTGTILSPLTIDGSAIVLLASSLLHHKGAARPIGGMGGLIAALERCLQAHGGRALTGSAVATISGRDRAEGVVLDDGSALHARRAVIAACPPQLVPGLTGAALNGAVGERVRRAPANSGGVGTLTVNVALSGRLELVAHQPRRHDLDLRRPTLFAGTLEDNLTASAEAARGDLPSRPPFCVAIMTAVDPSQAPAGQDVVQLYAPAPVAHRAGWESGRDDAADQLVARVAGVLPALPSLELGRYVESPSDLEARTGAVNGCIYHVDHLPTRIGPLRPAVGASGFRTPLPGLYLGSAGCHPGGGVSGLPGKLCATAVLKDIAHGNGATPRTTRRPVSLGGRL